MFDLKFQMISPGESQISDFKSQILLHKEPAYDHK
jgi:hypothetical protein